MDSAQIISNGEKARTGQEVKDKVGKLLEALRKEELILGFEIEVNHSHKYYGYDKQFKCDFVVKTVDSKFILIRASNSYRSDRAKIPFYDFLGIQQFSSFSGDIVASILLFPDGEEQNTTFISTRQKVQDGYFFSPATHWLTFSELNDFFANYCSEVEELKEQAEETEESEFHPTLTLYQRSFSDSLTQVGEKTGSYYGKSGNKFEKFLVEELNEADNLSAYKLNKRACFEYDVVLDSIVSELPIEGEEIQLLEATDTITKLQNGGSPKTDIHLRVYLSPKEYHIVNISVKNTTATRVSCHDYQAKDFVRVIAADDSDFRNLVETFQEAGSWKAYDSLILEKGLTFDTDEVLNSYIEKIIQWAVTGQHDTDHLIDEHTQLANFVLTRNAHSGVCKMQSATSYMEELKLAIGSGRGAPFSWTYPSKRRGQRIQLKMPISQPQY